MSLLNLPRLSAEEIHDIWAKVSCFIERQMITRKGVCIHGLGTFNFSFDKLTPIFILTEKLCHTYGFKQKKRQCSVDVPVVSLNFSSLSVEGPYERDRVEGCVRETILLLLRAASSLQSVAHTFPGIGVLTFKETRVKMIFYHDFISALDTAGKLSSTLTKRAESHSSQSQGNILKPAPTNAIIPPGTSKGDPQREDLKTEPSSAQRWINEEGKRADREMLTFTDKTSNTDRVVKLSQPAEDTLNINSVTDLNQMCSDHRRAGQELCYVCMQRAQRNIALLVSDDERRRVDQEQERVLMLNQQQKDLQYFQKQEMDRTKKREHSRHVAAFNLALAEVQRCRRTFNQTHGFYIPCTPNHRRQRCSTHEAESSRDQQTQRKHRQLEEEIHLNQSPDYQTSSVDRKALHTQSGDKLKIHLRSVFDLMDGGPGEQRHGAQKITEELKNLSIRKVIHKHLKEKEREQETIQKKHQEMLQEKICHYEQVRNLQAACEKNWQHSVSLRRQRDREEMNFRSLRYQNLTDQLEKYKRCRRCKRSTTNYGRSNLFRDTNYLSGSRFML